MGRWQRIRDAITPRFIGGARERRSTLSQPDSFLFNLFGGAGTKSGVAVSTENAMTVSTVYACVRILSEGVAMLPVKLYRKTANGREEAADHPVARLLKEQPNKNQTSFEWREMMQGHLCLRGNAYSRITRDARNNIIALDPIHPTRIQPYWTAQGEIAYQIAGEPQKRPEEILHLRALSTNGLAGISPITLMRETVGLALAIQNHASGSFANGNKFPGILKTPQSLQPKQVQELRDAWDSQRSGDNGAKVPILYGGLDWVSVGMNNTDAEMIASGVFQRKDIAEAFRIPLVMISHGDKASTYASVEQFMLSYVNLTLQPWLERWEQRLNLSLLTEQEKREGLYFKFNLKALLRGDAKSRAEFYRLMREMRAITINEIREGEEMNDFPDNIGDNPREGFNGQGGGQAVTDSAPADTAAATP